MSEKALEATLAQIPVGRLGKADEIGSLVAYIASEDAGFMTGSIIAINGGQYMANG
jgi:acetoacetyl-CoA reductase